MASVASKTGEPGETRIVLSHISWETYEALLVETDRSGTRFTYDEGVLEIMSPSPEHKRIKKLLARMVETMTEELEIPIASAGNTTWKSQLKQKGVEPDECYYVANEPRVRGRMDIDLNEDPPPDLAIEVDITASSIDQLRIYAKLGVPEVWICDGRSIRVYELEDDRKYTRRSGSRAFPVLPVEQLQRFIDEFGNGDETSWIRSFRTWVRQELKQSPKT